MQVAARNNMPGHFWITRFLEKISYGRCWEYKGPPGVVAVQLLKIRDLVRLRYPYVASNHPIEPTKHGLQDTSTRLYYRL
jgi:hypothetical protein